MQYRPMLVATFDLVIFFDSLYHTLLFAGPCSSFAWPNSPSHIRQLKIQCWEIESIIIIIFSSFLIIWNFVFFLNCDLKKNLSFFFQFFPLQINRSPELTTIPTLRKRLCRAKYAEIKHRGIWPYNLKLYSLLANPYRWSILNILQLFLCNIFLLAIIMV